MPKYLVTLYYSASVNVEVDAATPAEAEEEADTAREGLAEVYENLVFEEAVAQEILPDRRHVPLQSPTP